MKAADLGSCGSQPCQRDLERAVVPWLLCTCPIADFSYSSTSLARASASSKVS